MSNIDELIKNLTHPDWRGAEDATKAILAMRHDAVAPLVRALPQVDPKRALKIIELLEKIRDPLAVPAVSECLSADNGVIRTAAAQCLGVIGDKRATVPLLNALQENEHRGALIWIVQALGRLADHRAVDALLTVMQETESQAVRYTAIEALGLIGDRRAIEPIKQYRNNTSDHVSVRVEIALRQLSNDQSHAVLDIESTHFTVA